MTESIDKNKGGRPKTTERLQTSVSIADYEILKQEAGNGLMFQHLKSILHAYCNSEAVRLMVEGFYHKK